MAGSFLHVAGTNGIVGTVRTVTWTTSLNALASGARAISDTTADTGLFSQASFSNCQFGLAEFSHITNTLAATAGGCLACWFLRSRDAGGTYEAESTTTPSVTVTALPRPPDFLVPLYVGATAIPAGSLIWAPKFELPHVSAKLVVQNMSGAAFSAHNHTLNIFGVADGYT